MNEKEEMKTGQVTEQLEIMDVFIKRLFEIEANLSNRLEPVTLPECGPVSTSDGAKEKMDLLPEGLVPLADRLRGFNGSLDSLSNGLLATIESLEL